MSLLNYLYFLILTCLAISFLFSNGKSIRSPFNKEQDLKFNGPELFWVLTFSTGIIALQATGTLDLMAIRLLVLEALCIIGIFVCKDKPIITLPLVIYFVYLLWITIGCFYSPSPGYGIRVILKYIYPLVLCLFASAAVRYSEVMIKSALLARTFAFVSIIFGFVPLIGHLIPGVFWYSTALAINYISIMIFSLALFYFSNEKKKNIIYFGIFMLPCFLWVFRTSIMGSLVALMAFFFIRYKIRSLPIIATIIVLGVVAVFSIPSLRNKMFKKEATGISIENFQDGKIGMDEVNTNAREAMWKDLKHRFYKDHEIIGSGTGTVQSYMYNNHVFGGLKATHSDYVQMLCDNGIIGLSIYSIIVALIFLHCLQIYSIRQNPAPLKLCALVAGASIVGVFATFYSDNVFNYSMATLSMPFGFYGMTLGLQETQRA